MHLAITGATGNLGRLVIDALLERGTAAGSIIAAVRSPEKATDLAARGIAVREADYNRPETLDAAFAGVDRLLFISSSEVGVRAQQHRNVVDAAVRAAVGFIAYTSIPKADTTPMRIAVDHRVTEEAIRASGIPFSFLRNAWYMDFYAAGMKQTIARGALVGSAGNGRISAALRAEFAAAAAVVTGGEGHEGRVYELGGDEAFTMAELASEISRISGSHVEYRDMPIEEYARMLVGAGLPEPAAITFADADAGVARGDLHVTSGDLSRLIGRPTTRLGDLLRTAWDAAEQHVANQ